MTDIRRELLAAFEAEHREHLQAIRTALVRAEGGHAPDLREVFRRAHSLKGAARAVDMANVEDVAHALEGLVARLTDGSAELDARTIGAMRQALDTIEGLVAVATDRSAVPPGLSSDEAVRLLQGGGPDTAAAPAPVRPEVKPPPSEPDVPDPRVEDAPDEFLRVPVSRLEKLGSAGAALSAEMADLGALTDRLRGVERTVRALARKVGARADSELADLQRAVTVLARDQRRRAFDLSRAADDLLRAIAGVDHVTVGSVFGGFGRVVRDLARERGIEVQFEERGFDLLIDRGVLQALKDPVLHILRNAVSHGGEPPETRLARGRPRAMTVLLTCRIRSGRFVVSVRDDGRGPDVRRIETVAVERGLIPPRPPGAPPPPTDRLLQLVFEPGFSTADSVDRISGRGVGLSVVAEAVRRRHGTVHLSPRRAGGAEVVAQVPLVSSLQSTLVVEAAGRTYGLPTFGVERLVRLPAETIETVGGRPSVWIDFDGQDVVCPIVPLAALVGDMSVSIPVEAGVVKLVIARRGARRCALAVDDLVKTEMANVDALNGFGADPTLVTGVLLSDGVPVPVLDPEGLVGRWLDMENAGGSGTAGLADWQPAPATAPRTILVVDDSITTRTLEKGILEANGYRVLLSVDGLDALEVLRSGDAIVDLVVADIEMPRMDGFSLLATIRNDARLSRLPVVLMTSRAAPEDVRRGLELGADAYVTKQKFDQRELLATIGQLL